MYTAYGRLLDWSGEQAGASAAQGLAEALAPWHIYEPAAFSAQRLEAAPPRAVTVLVLRAYTPGPAEASTPVEPKTWGCFAWASAVRRQILPNSIFFDTSSAERVEEPWSTRHFETYSAAV